MLRQIASHAAEFIFGNHFCHTCKVFCLMFNTAVPKSFTRQLWCGGKLQFVAAEPHEDLTEVPVVLDSFEEWPDEQVFVSIETVEQIHMSTAAHEATEEGLPQQATAR